MYKSSFTLLYEIGALQTFFIYYFFIRHKFYNSIALSLKTLLSSQLTAEAIVSHISRLLCIISGLKLRIKTTI